MFGGKRPRDVSTSDLQKLIDEHWPENDQLEFKDALPDRKGNCPSPWVEKRQVTERARNELLAEIIAFANAHGGWLLLGIEETDEKPGRANRIAPIEDCAELADRLRMMCRDCIDPPLPVIELEGIEIDGDGAGVVVASIPQSRAAPHRLASTLHCYIRRHDRCEKLTMREIQDLTLNIARGEDAIQAKLLLARNRFDKFIGEVLLGGPLFGSATGPSGFGVRATAIPLTLIYIDQLDNDADKHAPLRQFKGKTGTDSFKIDLPMYGSDVVPLLRGRRWTSNRDRQTGSNFERDVYRDGVIDYRMARRFDTPDEVNVYASWIMAIWLNAMLAASLFRAHAGAPTVEYCLELEIASEGSSTPLHGYGHSMIGAFGYVPMGRMTLPVLSLGTIDEFSSLAALIEQDLFNAIGKDTPRNLEVSFPILA